MPVTEIETDGIIADILPADHGNTVKISDMVTAVFLPENITLTLGLSTGGRGAQGIAWVETLGAVIPGDADFLSDKLDVGGFFHLRGTIKKSTRPI